MINTINLPPFKRMCVTIGNLPSSFMESMSYYEALCWLYDYFEKTLLPAINTNSEAITELQTAFITLKTYVDDYFENLDVQTEINNKLDAMATAGTLEEIISAYLTLGSVLSYNTVADMKTAENLVDGSTCRTLGYHSLNDGGSALYKVREITNDDVVDEASIIALYDNTLVAELITIQINPITFGCYGDNTHDDTTNLQKAIDYTISKKIPLKSTHNKKYKITSTITIDGVIEMDLQNAEINGNFSDDLLTITNSNDSEYVADKTKYYIYGGYIRNVILNGNNTATRGLYVSLCKKMKFENIEIVKCLIGMEAHSGTESIFDTLRFQECPIGLKVSGYDMLFTNIFGRFCNIGMQLTKYTQIINSHFWVRPDEAEFTNSVYAEVYEGAKLINTQIDSYQTGIKTLGTGGYYLELSGQWQQPSDSLETFYLFKFLGASSTKNGFSVRLHDFNATCKTTEPYCIFSDIEADVFRGFIDYSTVRCMRITKFPLTTLLKLTDVSNKLTVEQNRVSVDGNKVHIEFFAKLLENKTYLEFAKLPNDGYINVLPLTGFPFIAITSQQYAVSNPTTQLVPGFCSRTRQLTLKCLDDNNPMPADSYVYINVTYTRSNNMVLSE